MGGAYYHKRVIWPKGEVSKRRSCHAPTVNMDRNAPFSSHHRFSRIPCLRPIASCDAIRSCLCSQVGGDVGGAYFTCALADSLTFIVVRDHVSISAQLGDLVAVVQRSSKDGIRLITSWELRIATGMSLARGIRMAIMLRAKFYLTWL